jgi:hypothetical protein
MFAIAILVLFAELNTVSAACTTGSGAGTFTNSICTLTAGAAEGFNNDGQDSQFSFGLSDAFGGGGGGMGSTGGGIGFGGPQGTPTGSV